MRSKAIRTTLLLPALFLFSCSASHYSKTSFGYGTIWLYHLFEGEEEVIDDLSAEVSLTSYLCDMEASSCLNGVYAINEGKEVEVDDYLFGLLKFGEEISEDTNGYFSLFAGSLTDLWLRNLQEGKLPNSDEIAAETELISQTSLIFSGKTVQKKGGAKLDLGGIGKGYCLKELSKTLEERNLASYWISAGESSLLLGNNPNGKDGCTKVEFEDLPGRYIYAKDCAISVSSNRKQLYEVDGKRYSHIVNPFTGSASSDIDAVIAKGNDASVLDALTTAIYLEGESRISYYEEKYDASFLLIKNEEVIYSSHGFEIEGNI